jgi:hypothetical protein
MKNLTKVFIAGSFLIGLLFSTGLNAGSSVSIFTTILDRGLEIHYLKMELKKGEEPPKTVTVAGLVYPLYKTKEEAYNNVLNAGLKKDITVVYVISSAEKATETITLK